jgi:hypothetical protein
LTVILNLRKVDRGQPAVPVNTGLLGLYETASSLELKTDPWILFLYGHFRRARGASTHGARQSWLTPLPPQSKRCRNRVRLAFPSTVSLELVGVGPP